MIIVKIVCEILIGNSENLINGLIGFVNEIFVYFFVYLLKEFRLNIPKPLIYELLRITSDHYQILIQ